MAERLGHGRGVVEDLYGEHYAGLHRSLLLAGCQPADADDYVQESFLRLCRFLNQGHTVHKPKSWLIRVVNNIRTDDTRREHRVTTRTLAELETQLAKSLSAVPDAESASLERERLASLEKATGRLTGRQHQFLILRAEGLKFREIAKLHGVTIQTVAETCARATNTLGRLTRK
jgi:RNA polymerase sigma-70 factor (ECF subfamily)